MINIQELELFGREYCSIILEDVNWYWSNQGIIFVSLNKGKKFRIRLKKLPEAMSLTKLLIRLKKMSLAKYDTINCYEGIAIVDNSTLSDEENYYLFSDGSITEFLYHKYYRNRDVGFLSVANKSYNWDGKAYGMKCKKLSKRLYERLFG